MNFSGVVSQNTNGKDTELQCNFQFTTRCTK